MHASKTTRVRGVGLIADIRVPASWLEMMMIEGLSVICLTYQRWEFETNDSYYARTHNLYVVCAVFYILPVVPVLVVLVIQTYQREEWREKRIFCFSFYQTLQFWLKNPWMENWMKSYSFQQELLLKINFSFGEILKFELI